MVGMMGAGKSAVGPVLADRLGRRFVDSDDEIERSVGMRIPEIFDRHGEGVFRAHEREVIEALAETDAVVALGGGAIAQPGAVERLGGSGTVVYLSAGIPTLLRRLGDCASRPLLRDLDDRARAARLSELLASRRKAYLSAAIVVETDAATVQHVVDEIARCLQDSAGMAS